MIVGLEGREAARPSVITQDAMRPWNLPRKGMAACYVAVDAGRHISVMSPSVEGVGSALGVAKFGVAVTCRLRIVAPHVPSPHTVCPEDHTYVHGTSRAWWGFKSEWGTSLW